MKAITIWLLPRKVHPENKAIKMINVNKNIGNFDIIVDRFEYYNCNNQTGRYASYYINE